MSVSVWPNSRLGLLLDKIELHYGRPRPPRFGGPFELIVWEIVAYLADDTRRAVAFDALREKVGLNPEKPRWSPENRPYVVTSKPANGADPEQEYLYPANEYFCKSFFRE
jgi:hypothetical protein